MVSTLPNIRAGQGNLRHRFATSHPTPNLIKTTCLQSQACLPAKPMRILSGDEMRTVDRLTTEQYSVPSLTLMENAGVSIASYCAARYSPLASRQILIVCGKGNNGGDGLVAARHIVQRGGFPHVVLLADYEQVQGDARVNLDAIIQCGQRPHSVTSFKDWLEYASTVPRPELLVDAILGTGLKKPAEGFLAQVIEDINKRYNSTHVLSVDLPSGLNADSHEVIGPTLRATGTVTMTAPKICLAFPPAAEWAGSVTVTPIGSPDNLLDQTSKQNLFWLTPEDCAFVVRPRPPNSHKGNFGHALIVAGSVGRTGAAVLAGRAALRSGAGLVTVATPASAQPIVAQSMPEIMTVPLPETDVGTFEVSAFDYQLMDRTVQDKTVLALGPGLSTHPATQEFARRLVARYRIPMVIDADGLNAFVDHVHEIDGRGRVLVLTPHPGEFARLLHSSSQVVQAARKDFAREFALRHQVFLVLKGFRTIIATPEGALYVCPTGNPGMAKAGTGDALTGLLTGLLAQFVNCNPASVIAAGVFLHGRAGDLARDKKGERALLASDLIDCLPDVFLETADTVLPDERGILSQEQL